MVSNLERPVIVFTLFHILNNQTCVFPSVQTSVNSETKEFSAGIGSIGDGSTEGGFYFLPFFDEWGDLHGDFSLMNSLVDAA